MFLMARRPPQTTGTGRFLTFYKSPETKNSHKLASGSRRLGHGLSIGTLMWQISLHDPKVWQKMYFRGRTLQRAAGKASLHVKDLGHGPGSCGGHVQHQERSGGRGGLRKNLQKPFYSIKSIMEHTHLHRP